jgi:hypothetical protein
VPGFTQATGTQHIVPRNPWGHHEGTLDVLTSPGTWSPGGTASNPPVEPVPPNTGRRVRDEDDDLQEIPPDFASFA